MKYSRKEIIAAAAAAAVLIAFYAVFRCPFRFFIGIPCPGCGMTRALVSLLRLDFDAAFHYHPLIFIMPFFAAYLFVRFVLKKQLLGKKAEKILLAFTVALFITVYLIRAFGGNDVVQTDFQNSVLHKIISFFTEAV